MATKRSPLSFTAWCRTAPLGARWWSELPPYSFGPTAARIGAAVTTRIYYAVAPQGGAPFSGDLVPLTCVTLTGRPTTEEGGSDGE